jgi:tetratricopeptide (TPR) repeat protein
MRDRQRSRKATGYPFGDSIQRKLDSVIVPFFRGCYPVAFERARQLREERIQDGRTAGVEGRLYEVVSMLFSPERSVEAAVKSALRLAKYCREVDGLQNQQRDFFEFQGLLFAGWALTSRRGRQKLGQAFDHLTTAIRRYEKARTMGYLIPGGWAAYQCRGWGRYHLGEIELAIQDFNRGVLCVNEYVSDLQDRGMIRKSPAAARRFIKTRMRALARLLALRATMFYELGDFLDALGDIDTAIEIDPENAYVRGLAGVIHFAMSGPRGRVAVLGVQDHHKEALEQLLEARRLYALGGHGSSGRAEHFLNLFLYQCKNDPSTQKALSSDAQKLVSEVTPDCQELTDGAFQKLLDTRRMLEAMCCILIVLDPLNPPDPDDKESRFGGRMLFQVLSTIDGFYDYLGSLSIHQARLYSLLTRSSD